VEPEILFLAHHELGNRPRPMATDIPSMHEVVVLEVFAEYDVRVRTCTAGTERLDGSGRRSNVAPSHHRNRGAQKRPYDKVSDFHGEQSPAN